MRERRRTVTRVHDARSRERRDGALRGRHFLPDGKHVIYLVTATQSSRVGNLDRVARRSVIATTRLVASDAPADRSSATPCCYLRDSRWSHSRSIPTTWRATGRSSAVAAELSAAVRSDSSSRPQSSDVLIYGAPGSPLRELRWVSSHGRDRRPAPASRLESWDLRIAPDGRRVGRHRSSIANCARSTCSFATASQPVPTRLSLVDRRRRKRRVVAGRLADRVGRHSGGRS